MAFKIFGKKEKFGQSSQINKLRSPYLKKTLVPQRKNKKKLPFSSALIPPAKFKAASSKGKKILAIILTTVIIIFCVYAVYFADYFLIDRYQVEEEGTIVDNNLSINEILEKSLGQNLVLLNDGALARQIKSLHPEINQLRVKKIFPKTLKIEFEKFPTVANIVNIANGIQKKFLVDSLGIITEENDENPDLPYIKIETKNALKLKDTLLPDHKRSEQRLTYIINAINLYEEKFGMKILSAVFKVKEREIHLYTEKSFFVMLDMEKDLNQQLEKLKKALTKLDIYKEPLIYIDLRISGTDNEKVIFKRR